MHSRGLGGAGLGPGCDIAVAQRVFSHNGEQCAGDVDAASPSLLPPSRQECPLRPAFNHSL